MKPVQTMMDERPLRGESGSRPNGGAEPPESFRRERALQKDAAGLRSAGGGGWLQAVTDE